MLRVFFSLLIYDGSIRKWLLPGAVVREDVPDFGVVIGNPTRLMPNQRTRELNYSPVMLNAPFEAWVGRYRVISQ